MDENAIIEKCALAIEPTIKDCACCTFDGDWWINDCDCGNTSDAESASAWCASKNDAITIRKLKT